MNKSPKRRPTTATNKEQSPRKKGALDESVTNLQDENQQLQFAAGEKDIEIERMKDTLIALNGKLQALTDNEKEVSNHREYLKTSEGKRDELHVHITELSQKIEVDTKAHDTKHTSNITEIQRLLAEIQSLKDQMNQRENEHLKSMEQVSQDHFAELTQKDDKMKKNERDYNDDLTAKEKDHLDKTQNMQDQHKFQLKNRDNEHQAELRQLDQDKTQRENEYIQKTQDLRDAHAKELKEVRDAHEKETRQAEDRHQDEKRRLEYEMRTQKERSDEKLKSEMEMATQKLKETIQAHTEEMQRFRQDQERKDAEHRDLVDKMRGDFEKQFSDQQRKHDGENREREDRHNKDVKDRINIQEKTERDLNEKMEKLRQEKDEVIRSLTQKMDEQRASYESKIDKLTIIIETREKEILVLKSTIMALQEDLHNKKDVEAQLAEALKREEDNNTARDKLNQELQQLTDYVLELEMKVYRANRTSLDLLKQLKDAEMEIETLKQYIIDLKQRIAVYIPVKEDSIDKKLAEFINNYPERSKLKIMFMRESEGVYQFGTKRVAVKVEKDNIKIRVGGGYLSLDEFLDQYTPVELEKLERKDPLKRFSEKIAVQKTIVNAGVREDSPVRSPARAASPKKSQR